MIKLSAGTPRGMPRLHCADQVTVVGWLMGIVHTGVEGAKGGVETAKEAEHPPSPRVLAAATKQL